MAIMSKVEGCAYQGTYSKLLNSLKQNYNRPHGLPKSPKGLSDLLKRHAQAMQKLGVEVIQHPERKSDGYWVTITRDDYTDDEFDGF